MEVPIDNEEKCFESVHFLADGSEMGARKLSRSRRRRDRTGQLNNKRRAPISASAPRADSAAVQIHWEKYSNREAGFIAHLIQPIQINQLRTLLTALG